MTKITPSALFNTMQGLQTDQKPSASSSHTSAFNDLLLNQLSIPHKSHIALHGQRNMNSASITNTESTSLIPHKNAALSSQNQEIAPLYLQPFNPAAIKLPTPSKEVGNQISPPVIALNSQASVANTVTDGQIPKPIDQSAQNIIKPDGTHSSSSNASTMPAVNNLSLTTKPVSPISSAELAPQLNISQPDIMLQPNLTRTNTISSAAPSANSLLDTPSQIQKANPATGGLNLPSASNNVTQYSTVDSSRVERTSSNTHSPVNDLTTTTTLLSKTANTTNSNEQSVANQPGFFDNAAASAANMHIAPLLVPVNTITNANNVQSFSIAPALGESAWSNALGVRVQWMAQNNLQTARLTINPEHLGPIHIQVQMNNQQASIQFFSAQPEVREALQASIPILSNTLAQEGIQLTNSSVSPQGFFNSDSRQPPATSPAKALRPTTTTTTVTADSTSMAQNTVPGLGLINLYI
jgi:hypothetical protein